jgi:radical SAM protein with 4Fe4S-binding SPASM domain
MILQFLNSVNFYRQKKAAESSKTENIFEVFDCIITKMKKSIINVTEWLKNRSFNSHFGANIMDKKFRCPMPTKFFIESGNICNLRCPFCGTGLQRKGSTRGFMSLNTFKIILAKIEPYTKHISLYNYGEPFLNKDFLEMASLSTASGIACATHSNLTAFKFDDEFAENVIRSGLSFISASIDGASQESYSRYRVGGNFDLAIENLALLQRTKDRLGLSHPELVWKFLINAFNEHEQAEAQDIAKTIGVPIEFHLMDVWGNAEWKSSLHFEQEVWGQEREFSRIINSPEKSFENRVFPVSIEHLELHPQLNYWCEQPFDAMVINWNGEVFPCVTTCDDRFSLGNILKTDIETLWNNSKYRACREFLYNFGPVQKSNAVCAILNCELKQKYLETARN